MKDFICLIAVTGSLVLVYLAARSMGRASAERWWKCSWCGCYFSEGDEVSNVPPVEPIKSHGICQGCRKREVEQWKAEKLIK